MKKLAIILTLALFVGMGMVATNTISNVKASDGSGLVDTCKTKKACVKTSACTGTKSKATKSSCEKTKCPGTKTKCCPGDEKKK